MKTNYKLIKLFELNKLDDFYNDYFLDSEIKKVTFSKKQFLYNLYININNLLPISVLKKIDFIFLNNKKIPIKFWFIIKNLNYNLNNITEYINYIEIYLLNNNNKIFNNLLLKNKIILNNNYLNIYINSYSEKKILDNHFFLIKNELIRLGFNNFDFFINIFESDFSQNFLSNNNQDINFFKNLKDININININNVNISGKIFYKKVLFTSNKRYFYTFMITDLTDSISAKYFTKDNKKNIIMENLLLDQWVNIFGDIKYDNFSKDQVIFIKKIYKIDKNNNLKNRIDNYNNKKRIELHVHTKMSAMDSVVDIKKLFKKLSIWKHKSVAIIDHINVQSFPEVYNVSLNYPEIKVIYGLEAEFINDNIFYVRNNNKKKLINSKYLIFDIETTGLSSEYDEIIEFGAVIIDGINGVRKKINYLFKPNKELNEFIVNLTGINNELLKDKPTFKEGAKKILKYFINKDYILVAHNSSFDIDFLQAWFKKLGFINNDISNTIIDTLQISRILNKNLKNHRLRNDCKTL